MDATPKNGSGRPALHLRRRGCSSPLLVPNLRDGRTVLVNLAVASLSQQARVGIRVAAYRSRRQHPRLHEHLRVFDRDVVQDCIALTRESLYDMHLIGVEETAPPQPCRIDESDGVEHERVALPPSHGISQIRNIERGLCVVRAAIGRDHAILAVSAAGIASKIEKGNIPIRLVDASGRALPRDSQRLTGHNRVILVRPHVELLNFVPVLRLLQWTIQIAEPRGRVELKIFSLIGLPATVGTLRWSASARTPRHVVPNPVRIGPVARQVRMPGQHRRGRRLVYWRFRLGETAFEQSAWIGPQPKCFRHPGHSGPGRALRTCPKADEPLLLRPRHRAGLPLRWTDLRTGRVFVPGVQPADHLDVRVRLSVWPRAGVLNPLTEGLVVDARTIFRQRARLSVHLNRALALIFERGDHVAFIMAL